MLMHKQVQLYKNSSSKSLLLLLLLLLLTMMNQTVSDIIIQLNSNHFQDLDVDPQIKEQGPLEIRIDFVQIKYEKQLELKIEMEP